MRIVITGGAGFVGSHLCQHYLDKGNEVICVDNLSTGRFINILDLCNNDNFEFISHDVTNPLSIEGKVDAILHFASPASPPAYQKLAIETLKVGSLGTHNMLGLAKEKKAKFLLASTSEIYGDAKVSPQPESYYGNVNCVGERGCYDEAKRFAEALTMAYHNKHGIDTKIARIFNTYGLRLNSGDGRVIPNFVYQALHGNALTIYGSGEQTRSFCHISDLVAGIDLLLSSPLHEPINLGNPNEITILELAKMIKKMCYSQSLFAIKRFPADDPLVRCPDITKAKQYLGWSPKVALEDGLREYIQDSVYKFHREI